MNKFVLIMIAIIAAIASTQTQGQILSLRDYTFEPSAADSIDNPTEQPADSGCCDEPVITGQIVIPSQSSDSLGSRFMLAKKPSPSGALLRSLLIPGWGQVYNKKYIKAALYAGTEIYLIHYVRWRWKQMDMHEWYFTNSSDTAFQAEHFASYEKARDSRDLHMWLTGLVVVVSMFDAYVDAHLADFDQPDKAFEVYLLPEDDRVQLGLVYNFR